MQILKLTLDSVITFFSIQLKLILPISDVDRLFACENVHDVTAEVYTQHSFWKYVYLYTKRHVIFLNTTLWNRFRSKQEFWHVWEKLLDKLGSVVENSIHIDFVTFAHNLQIFRCYMCCKHCYVSAFIVAPLCSRLDCDLSEHSTT